MKIISFAWTIEPLLGGRKTVTRRKWSDKYARRFKHMDLVQAYDRQPEYRGRCMAIIELAGDPYKEPLSAMTDEEEKAEGGLWGSAWAFIDDYSKGADARYDFDLWVIRFEVIKVEPAGLKYMADLEQQKDIRG